MKEAIVYPDQHVEIQDVGIPEPGPEQVVIRVVVSGLNPKDWYVRWFLFGVSIFLHVFIDLSIYYLSFLFLSHC